MPLLIYKGSSFKHSASYSARWPFFHFRSVAQAPNNNFIWWKIPENEYIARNSWNCHGCFRYRSNLIVKPKRNIHFYVINKTEVKTFLNNLRTLKTTITSLRRSSSTPNFEECSSFRYDVRLPTPLTTFSNFVISSYFFLISNKILKDEILKVWKMVIVNIDVRESRFKIMSYLPDQRQWES